MKLKSVPCCVCGKIIDIPVFDRADIAKCPECKAAKRKPARLTSVGSKKPRAQRGGRTAQAQGEASGAGLIACGKPAFVHVLRNRSKIEANVIFEGGEVVERVPAEWLSRQNTLDYLSVSKIQTYQQCPHKFFLQYISESGQVDDDGNIFTWFGSILHEVVELAEKAYAETGLVIPWQTFFDDAWKKQQLTDLSMYKEAQELIAEYFARHPVNAQNCKTLAIEQEWRGELPGLDVPFGLQMDYIGELSADTLLIRDYKTNRMPFTPYELEDSLQLGAYEMVARKLYPQYKRVITGYELFRFGWQPCPERKPEDLDAILHFIIDIWAIIKNDNTWSPKINSWCGYCNRRFECTKYAEFVQHPATYVDAFAKGGDISGIMAERETMAAYEKTCKSRKEYCDGIIKDTVIENSRQGRKTIITKELADDNAATEQIEVSMYQQRRDSYNFDAVKKVLATQGLEDMLDDCISIGKTKFEKKLKGKPNLTMQLATCTNTTYTEPSITTHKVK